MKISFSTGGRGGERKEGRKRGRQAGERKGGKERWGRGEMKGKEEEKKETV